ncbi:MAG TPA: amidohydrolase family protein [Thermomicrobiaceae bacterium]|nr:amidohydrolase family protein [Thermomicrobiaceae bacterium]
MRLIIRAERVFDGSGAAPRAAEVVVEGERIVEVNYGAGTLARDDDQVLELRAGTLLPGLIDAHVHLIGSGEPGDRAFGLGDIVNSIPTVTLNCFRNAQRDLEAGFTTVRDAACRYYADISLRDAINRGELTGPRIWACGLGITSTAGHMDREKILPPHLSLPGPSAVADGPVEARTAVRQNLRYDVDFIKFNATLTEHVRRYQAYCAPEMTAETMQALIEEAHWHGRRVTAHCYGGPGADWALDAGIDGIEHGFYLSDEQLARMGEQGTVLCPTLSVVGRFREQGARALPPNAPHLEAWRQKAIANAWKTAGRAHELGVKIICGTDAAMPYVTHGGNAYELEMLVEAGLTPGEALVAATSGAAEAIAFPEVGRIAPGAYADLVLVDGDPLADIRVLQQRERIALVIKGGAIVADRRAAVPTAVPAAAD